MDRRCGGVLTPTIQTSTLKKVVYVSMIVQTWEYLFVVADLFINVVGGHKLINLKEEIKKDKKFAL